MEFIEVEYNRELNALESVLSGVTHPGSFCAFGTAEIAMPRVEVGGAGTLSFPIPPEQIASIVRHATRAPYGRGEETIVDTSVRNVWQIAPAAVKISGKSWAGNFDNILAKVKAGLGCEDVAVSTELYKLLVYEPGGFFLAHRDTEKTPGMFGTLVLTLPSSFRGGALRVRHRGSEVTVDAEVGEPSEISFAAFYADCEHEVLPVLEGNRVCLVYNLIQDKARRRSRALEAPDYGSQVDQTAAVLKAYWRTPGAPAKIAWLLDHQYSPAGLSFAALKGADAARAQVLTQAAAQAGSAVYLAMVHIEETGAAEADFDYRPRRRYHAYDEEAEDEDEDVSFEAVTVDNSWQYLDEWRGADARAGEFGRIPLDEGELLPAGALDNEPPDQKRLTEASGNEGATYERSYHRAVLVLWPADRTIDVLLQGGVSAALPYLKRLVESGQDAHRDALAVARRIVKAWPAGERPATYFAASAAPPDRAGMVATLVDLDAKGLLERFIRQVVTAGYDGSENDALRRSTGTLGDKKAAAVLSELIGTRMADRPSECVELMLALSNAAGPALRPIALAAVAGLDRIGSPPHKDDDPFRGWEDYKEKRRQLTPQFITTLFAALTMLGSPSLCEDAAKKIASRPDVFHPVTLVVPAIAELSTGTIEASPSDRAVQRLWTSAAEFLLERSEVPPPPPSDWRLDATLSCKCPDCRELQAFARDPAERVHRFRINKDRRQHLHQTIDRQRLDMTHVTERSGSPQTLVCTKDRRSFNARMQQYRAEIAAMRRLLELTPDAKPAAALAKRLSAAADHQ